MKRSLAVLPLLLAGCAWNEPMYTQPIAIHNQPDPAARIMLQCDQLGMRSPEAQRLCQMRGIDRLAIYPSKPTISHVPLLPYAYPPLAPGGSGSPHHYHFQGSVR